MVGCFLSFFVGWFGLGFSFGHGCISPPKKYFFSIEKVRFSVQILFFPWNYPEALNHRNFSVAELVAIYIF